MTDTHWQKIWEIFHEAVERPVSERLMFLASACQDDALREEVQSLLAEHESSDALIDHGPSLLETSGEAMDEAKGHPPSESPLLSIGRRYRLVNRLGRGGMGEVYRAFDRLTGQIVALKKILEESTASRPISTSAPTLTAPVERTRGLLKALSDSGTRRIVGRELALAREFRLLASLRHPHIISVLDYGFAPDGQPYFTMPLLEDATTVLEAAIDAPFDVRIDFLIRILQALEYLHLQGVIHRDLKPNNILVSDERLKLLDFGISILRREASHKSTRAAGTLLYMAPEVLAGEPASPAADLFAVGVVAYELLADRHPFAESAAGAWVRQIFDRPLDTEELPAPPEVREVVARLLERAPDARYPQASDALEALCRATGQPSPIVSGSIRDSFLQAARFVGREAELEQLTRRLATATAGGGGVQLIAGESGVGKSRLLEELRSLALVEGVLVVRGQAIRSGSSPYQVWRDVIRRLILECQLGDLEAGVLLSLVPDLAQLLDRPIQPAPELEPRAARGRLRTTIRELLRRQRSATLVILEDLQWADSESLELLERIRPLVKQLPILILGSLRDDEMSQLPESLILGERSPMRLKRLEETAIGELCRSMLGTERATPALVRWLARETEGNAFFLVESVRALAEEAGGLEHIATRALPEQVKAGGIQRVVERRLEQVPSSARPLLRAAAVAGRQLDLQMLAALKSEIPLEPWLAAGVAASVLEIDDDVWRFQHDKLREGLLDEMSSAALREVHRQVALAIESLPTLAATRSAALAHHWMAAEDRERARPAAERAGREALASGAHQDAIHWLEAAIDLQPRHDDGNSLAHLEYLVALAHHSLGHLAPCRRYLERSLSHFGSPLPQGLRLGGSVLIQILQQARYRLLAGRSTKSLGDDRNQQPQEQIMEAIRAYLLWCETHYITGDPLPLIYGLLQALNLAENVGTASELDETPLGGRSLQASVYAACGTAFALVLRPLGWFYARRAHAVAVQGRSLPDVGFAYLATSGFFLGVGAFAEAEVDLHRGHELFQQVGDGRRWGQIVAWQAAIAELRGDYAQCRQYALAICDSSERRGDNNTRAYGLTYRASMALLRGAYARAIELCQEALAGLEGNIDWVEEKRARGLLARAHLYRGNFGSARLEAEKAARLSAGSPPTMPHSLTGYAGVAEVTLALWERSQGVDAGQDPESPPPRRLAADVRQAIRELERYARALPIGRPRARLARGRLAWLQGHRRSARRASRAALQAAQHLSMPLEEAIAHRQLGSYLEAGDRAGRQHRSQAQSLLKRLAIARDAPWFEPL